MQAVPGMFGIVFLVIEQSIISLPQETINVTNTNNFKQHLTLIHNSNVFYVNNNYSRNIDQVLQEFIITPALIIIIFILDKLRCKTQAYARVCEENTE